MAIAPKNYLFLTKKPVVLVAPLDWGLGHATRCIPVIHYLLTLGSEVIIACDGLQRTLLEAEFPLLRFVLLKGYRLRYGSGRSRTICRIILQIPSILSAIRREHRWLARFIADNQVDAVISDNRYGLYNRKIPSVFMTHQLTVRTPFGKHVDRLVRRMNYRLISKFSACWVPDYAAAGSNLAGELSHPPFLPPAPVSYLGRLSRLNKPDEVKKSGVLIILSGPEPQRTAFETVLLSQLQKYPEQSCTLVRGLPGVTAVLPPANACMVVYNHLEAASLGPLIAGSDVVISRSGYSTIMDLAGMGCKCIFVPTPGQSEQEYLAGYLSRQKRCLSYRQENFDLRTALQKVKELERFPAVEYAADEYKQVIAGFVEKLRPSR